MILRSQLNNSRGENEGEVILLFSVVFLNMLLWYYRFVNTNIYIYIYIYMLPFPWLWSRLRHCMLSSFCCFRASMTWHTWHWLNCWLAASFKKEITGCFLSLPDNARESDFSDLLAELELLKKVNKDPHPNVIRFIGGCSLKGKNIKRV